MYNIIMQSIKLLDIDFKQSCCLVNCSGAEVKYFLQQQQVCVWTHSLTLQGLGADSQSVFVRADPSLILRLRPMEMPHRGPFVIL